MGSPRKAQGKFCARKASAGPISLNPGNDLTGGLDSPHPTEDTNYSFEKHLTVGCLAGM